MFIVSMAETNTDGCFTALMVPAAYDNLAAARAHANKLVRDHLERDPEADVQSDPMDLRKTVFAHNCSLRLEIHVDELPDLGDGSK